MYKLTNNGKKVVRSYIAELKAKRKEILDAGKDTADYTELPTERDIVDDIEFTGVDEGEYYNSWGVTDNYDADYPLSLRLGEDFVVASTSINATEDYSYNHILVTINKSDRDYVMQNLNRTHKTLGRYGVAGDPGYYVSEFEEGTPGFMWVSDTGLRILDENNIPYERVVKSSTSIMTRKRYVKANGSSKIMTSMNAEIISRAKEVVDYFSTHNRNLNGRQDATVNELSDAVQAKSISGIRSAIEDLKYNSKNLNNNQYYLVIDLYDDFNLAGGKFNGMGRV